MFLSFFCFFPSPSFERLVVLLVSSPLCRAKVSLQSLRTDSKIPYKEATLTRGRAALAQIAHNWDFSPL